MDDTRSPRTLSRRSLLAGATAVGTYGAMLGAAGIAEAADDAPRGSAANVWKDPFTLGVASGDPTSDGVVLWTRLAMEPLAINGRGAMPHLKLPVRWQLAADEDMREIVEQGVEWALPSQAHSVHVEVDGLEPDRRYWYRFRLGRYVTGVGRTRTAPSPDAMPDRLRMCFVSCQEYEHGYFHAFRALVADDPDLVIHLGDYIYEYPKDKYVAPSGNVRDHAGTMCVSLGNYRRRYAQYRTDRDLQEAHAIAPWIVAFDDHEVSNDWRDMSPQEPWEWAHWAERRAAAFQAYWENMPLRRAQKPHGVDIQLYRRLHWGRLATFHVLDTRQYAAPNACGGGYHVDCPEVPIRTRTMLGWRQEGWLLDGFRASHARWDVLAQQTNFSQRDNNPEPALSVNTDCWDGYAPTRERVVNGWLDAKVRNPVVISGDVHAHWASDLKLDFDDPDAPVVGAEFVTTSITSTGDGKDGIPEDHPYLRINRHLRFYVNLRGYVRTTITPDRWETDYRCVPVVSRESAAFTRRSFALDDGDPRMRMTYDRPPAFVPAGGSEAEQIAEVVWLETGDDDA